MLIADLSLKNIGILELMIKLEELNNLLMEKVLSLIFRVHFMKVLLRILKGLKKLVNTLILKLQSVWYYLILKKMFLQDLVETLELQIIGGQIMLMKMEIEELILIEFLQEEIEVVIEDEVIEEVMVVTKVDTNNIVMIDLIISKNEEDIIKRVVHGEVEEVIVEEEVGTSEFMKFKLNEIIY
jgi:hypothetical protein